VGQKARIKCDTWKTKCKQHMERTYALPIFFPREIRQIQTKFNKKRALRHVFVHVWGGVCVCDLWKSVDKEKPKTYLN